MMLLVLLAKTASPDNALRRCLECTPLIPSWICSTVWELGAIQYAYLPRVISRIISASNPKLYCKPYYHVLIITIVYLTWQKDDLISMLTDSHQKNIYIFFAVVSSSFRCCVYKCSEFLLAKERLELVEERPRQLSIRVGRAEWVEWIRTAHQVRGQAT